MAVQGFSSHKLRDTEAGVTHSAAQPNRIRGSKDNVVRKAVWQTMVLLLCLGIFVLADGPSADASGAGCQEYTTAPINHYTSGTTKYYYFNNVANCNGSLGIEWKTCLNVEWQGRGCAPCEGAHIHTGCWVKGSQWVARRYQEVFSVRSGTCTSFMRLVDGHIQILGEQIFDSNVQGTDIRVQACNKQSCPAGYYAYNGSWCYKWETLCPSSHPYKSITYPGQCYNRYYQYVHGTQELVWHYLG